METGRWAEWRDRDLVPRERWVPTVELVVMLLLLALSVFVFFLSISGGTAPIRRDLVKQKRAALLRRKIEGDDDEVPITATIFLLPEKVAIADDDGMLLHESGWLLFRGSRSEWSVKLSDVEPTTDGFGFVFPAPDGSRRCVSFDDLTDDHALSRTVREWMRAPEPPEPSVWPPPTPLARRDPFGAAGSGWLFGGVGLIAGATVGPFGHLASIFVTAGLVCGVIGTYFAVRRNRAMIRALPKPPDG